MGRMYGGNGLSPSDLHPPLTETLSVFLCGSAHRSLSRTSAASLWLRDEGRVRRARMLTEWAVSERPGCSGLVAGNARHCRPGVRWSGSCITDFASVARQGPDADLVHLMRGMPWTRWDARYFARQTAPMHAPSSG